MAKRKLLVLAGAGASIDFGMPSVNQVDQLLTTSAQPYFSLATNSSLNLYTYIRDQLSAYRTKHYKLAPPVNFEDVLYTITVLESYYPAGYYTGPLGAFLSMNSIPAINHFGLGIKPVDANILQHLAHHLVDELLNEFRKRCSTTVPHVTELNSFFSALKNEFDLAVVTTNYDNLIYQALMPIETGFADDGIFVPGKILGRRAWPCILHLHGSVHFDMDIVGANLHAIKWQPDLNGQFHQNSSGRSPSMSSGGNKFPTSAIIAGGHKTDQILRLPFRTYYAEMEKLIHQSDALLCCGFSFTDAHVRGAFESYRDGRDRPIVVIDYAADGDQLAGSSFGPQDTSAQRMINMSGILPGQMEALGYKITDTVDSLKAAKDFQRHDVAGKRLSIWYNGMLEACRNPDGVIKELEQNQKCKLSDVNWRSLKRRFFNW